MKVRCFLSVVLFSLFSVSAVHSQTVAENLSTYKEIPIQNNLNTIKKGTSLESAMKQVEKKFGITFLYESETVLKKNFKTEKALSSDLEQTLLDIFDDFDLAFKKVGTSSYAIFKKEIPEKTGSVNMVEGVITGTIVDNKGEPVPAATIYIEETGSGTASNMNGEFTLNLDPGTYTLRITSVGYAPVERTVELDDGETIELNIELKPDIFQLESVVATATRTERTQKESSISMTTIPNERIQELNPNSAADVLRTVPGVHAEGGGGEVASNVFVRGLPAPGQFKYNPIEEDGMPVQSTGGITTSARDIYFRQDLTIETVEFVRGGSSSLFGVGSPAGIINYISKTGGTTPQTTIKTTVGQDNLYRFDFNTGGPLAKDLVFNLGGFYRYDEGPVKTGLATEGLQLKGNFTKRIDNGYVRLYAKYLDDQAQFFLPFPHERGSEEPAIGNDGKRIRTLNSAEAANFSYRTPDGIFESNMGDGISAKGTAFMLEFTKDLGDGWIIENNLRWTDMDHRFNIFIPFPAFQEVDAYANQFITDPSQQARYSYTNDPGQTFTGDYVVDQGAWDWHRPFTDISADVNLSKRLEGETMTHNITVGGFLARTTVQQKDIHNAVLVDFADQPRLVDLDILDANGNVVTQVTSNGISSGAQVYLNNEVSSNKVAFYIGDEVEINDLRVDAGFRYEVNDATLSVEGSEATTVASGPDVPLALQGFQWGNGEYTSRDVRFTDFAAALGINYALTDNMNVYATSSRGYFFPELQTFTNNPGRDGNGNFVQTIPENESFFTVEGGAKYGSPVFSGTAALYYTQISNRLQNDPQQGSDGIIRTITRAVGESTTMGVEITGGFAPPALDGLLLEGNITLQDHQFSDFANNPDFNGNWIPRQPKFMTNLNVGYDIGNFGADLRWKYLGKRYAGEANFQELAPFSMFSGNLGYTFDFTESQTLRLALNAFNILDSNGFTEGDPRLPPGVNPNDQPYFNARPILPRRFSLSLTYNF